MNEVNERPFKRTLIKIILMMYLLILLFMNWYMAQYILIMIDLNVFPCTRLIIIGYFTVSMRVRFLFTSCVKWATRNY